MKRNKKNTVNGATGSKLGGNGSGGGNVKGILTAAATDSSEQKLPAEVDGPKGPEPTRYGDWEQKGRCTDF